jgi:hypothetical protein
MGFSALSKLSKLLHAWSITHLLLHPGLGPALAELIFFSLLNVHYLQHGTIYAVKYVPLVIDQMNGKYKNL